MRSDCSREMVGGEEGVDTHRRQIRGAMYKKAES